MRIRLDLDQDTLNRLALCACRERRTAEAQAEVLLTAALREWAERDAAGEESERHTCRCVNTPARQGCEEEPAR